MGAYTLSKTSQIVGRIRLGESGSVNDRTFQVKAYYQTTSNPLKVNVTVQLVFESNGNVSGSGTCNVNGTPVGFSFSRNSTSNIRTFEVSYNSSGQSKDNGLSVSLSNMSARWSDGSSFDASPENDVSTTYDLPNIDPIPSVSITGISIVSGGYNSQAIASISKIRVTVLYTNIRNTLNYQWSGAGQTGTGSVSVTYSQSENTATFDINVPANSDNYTLTVKASGSNNTSSATSSDYNYAVKGYFLPYYTSQTYTMRCDVNGNADAQGEYGRLYLKWATCLIDNTNTLINCTVKLNGTVLVNGQNCVITGSISAGYLNYVFPLQLNTQGDLGITFQDHILTAPEITALAVPKSIMALSLYQNNTDVGVTIGRMATQAGFYEALDFYLKGKDHGTFYELSIDTNGVLYVNGNPVAYTSGGSV